MVSNTKDLVRSSRNQRIKDRLLRIRRIVFHLRLSFRHLTFLRRRRKADYGEKQSTRFKMLLLKKEQKNKVKDRSQEPECVNLIEKFLAGKIVVTAVILVC